MVKARQGPGVELAELPKPSPGPDDVVMRVSAVGICGGDISIYDRQSSEAPGTPPFIPGHEAVGEIVDIGSRVEGFGREDRIAVETHIPCLRCHSCRQGYLNLCDDLRIFGVTSGTNGAFAEYAVVPSKVAYKVPDEIDDEVGALLEPLGVGVHAVSKSGLVVGDSTAVLGCGSIGLFIIALLKLGGAAEIIATDVSSYRLGLARLVGATATINAKEGLVAPTAKDITRGVGPRLVFEASGSPQALVQAFDIVSKRGKIVPIAGHPSTSPLDFTKNVHLKEVSVEGIYGREIWATWNRTAEILRRRMIDSGPIITHRYPLEKLDEAIATAKKAEAGKILLEP